MGKLNKSEIRAIAEDIVEKIKNSTPSTQSKYEKWLKEFKTTSEYKLFESYNEAIIAMENNLKVYKRIRNFNGWERDIKLDEIDIEEICMWKFIQIFPECVKQSELPSVSSIEREIIIAQAKNESVDAIIETIINKYKK